MSSGDNIVGRIIFINRGNYNSNTIYNKLDIVRYSGKNFLAKETSKGKNPTGYNNDNYWQLLTSNGNYYPSLNDNGILI